jgi:hypothetical protein
MLGCQERLQPPCPDNEEAPTGGRGFFGSSGEQRDGREAVTSSGIALGELRTTPSIMNILS